MMMIMTNDDDDDDDDIQLNSVSIKSRLGEKNCKFNFFIVSFEKIKTLKSYVKTKLEEFF